MSYKKYLIYSDPHFCSYSSIVRDRSDFYSKRLDNLIKSISWLENEAEKNNCDEIICAGDFFDKPELNCEEITAIQELPINRNIKHTFLVGNHESNVSNLGFSSTEIFRGFGSDVISEITVVHINDKVDLYYLPYMTTDNLKPLSEIIKNKNKKNIIISHNDIAGIQYGRIVSTAGYSLDEINKYCTLFLNGHLHNGTTLNGYNGKLILLGNVTGQNFGEDASKYIHSIWYLTVYDDGNIELEQVENPYALNFYKLYIYDLESFYTTIDKIKPNSVVSLYCRLEDLITIKKYLEDCSKIINYRLTLLYDESTSTYESDITDFTVDDHLQQFISYVQSVIEPSDILSEELGILGGD